MDNCIIKNPSIPGIAALEQTEMNRTLRQQLALVTSLLTSEQQNAYKVACETVGISSQPPVPTILPDEL